MEQTNREIGAAFVARQEDGRKKGNLRYLSVKKQKLFLQNFASTMNKTHAAHLSGIKDPSQVNRQINADPEFAEQFLAIKEGRLDELEGEQWQDAKIRPEDRRWVLERQRPEEWSKKTETKIEGEVKHIHQLSDKQLEALVQQYLPEAIDAEFEVEE